MSLAALEKRRKRAKRMHGTLGEKRHREIRHAVAEKHQQFVAAAARSRRNNRKALAILVAVAIAGVPVALLFIYFLKI